MRVGTLDGRLGGVPLDCIVDALTSGQILIPHMAVVPSFVAMNPDQPPEIELKFELERDLGRLCCEWNNWQLQFVHNQLFEHFQVLYCTVLHCTDCVVGVSQC